MQRSAGVRAYKYDLRVKPKEFVVGQFVWVYYPRTKPGLKEKWTSWDQGPYKLESRVGPVLYQVRRTPRGKAKLVYVDKLKPYYGPIPVTWGGGNPARTSFRRCRRIPGTVGE